ncbi:MAG: SDR family oxidoreductase [Acidobacteria bacterium]|nr:SDR family oxidoreductase [Acidobacteriota bacterium]
MGSSQILITGSTGIAAATAALARGRGHQVVTVGLEDNADVRADLRDEAEVHRAFQEAVDKLGGLRALFNCAGASGRQWGDGPLHDCSTAGFDETLRTNLRTMFLMTRSALNYWLTRGEHGSVLQMGSVTAFHPQPDYFAAHAYAAAKGAAESMTTGAASYYARYHIRMNVIAPGLVRSPMSLRAQSDPAIMHYIESKQPLTGILEPEQVARTALFLLSEESAPITGQVVNVDGGWAVSP